MSIFRVSCVGCAVFLGGVTCWAGSGVPTAVSPGTSTGSLIGEACPTFIWGAVPEADSYELVVYRLNDETDSAESVLTQLVAGTALAWTPSLDRCLKRGGRYAWSVRAVGQESSDWSPPGLFEVARGPSVREVEAALDIVKQYLATASEAELSRLVSDDASLVAPSLPTQPVAETPAALAATILSVDGGVEASSFSGDGSALTNVTASDLVGTASVSVAELDFDPATQAEMDAHAANASAHHVPPTTLPPSGAAGGDLTGTYPDPAVSDAIARDSEVASGIAAHATVADAHREHASLEESAEIDAHKLSDDHDAAYVNITGDAMTGPLTLPALSAAERDALSEAAGMLVYNTSTSRFQGYKGGGEALDQAQTTSNSQLASRIAQTFRAGVSGQLTKLRIKAWDFFGEGSHTVTIKQGDPNSGSVLATETFSLTGTSPEWNDIVFASPPTVSVGDLYSFVFQQHSLEIDRDTANPYSDGEAWGFDGGTGFLPLVGGTHDFVFETYVLATPGWVDLH